MPGEDRLPSRTSRPAAAATTSTRRNWCSARGVMSAEVLRRAATLQEPRHVLLALHLSQEQGPRIRGEAGLPVLVPARPLDRARREEPVRAIADRARLAASPARCPCARWTRALPAISCR